MWVNYGTIRNDSEQSSVYQMHQILYTNSIRIFFVIFSTTTVLFIFTILSSNSMHNYNQVEKKVLKDILSDKSNSIPPDAILYGELMCDISNSLILPSFYEKSSRWKCLHGKPLQSVCDQIPWTGVTCKKDAVTHIELRDVYGKIHSSIGFLHALQSLIIADSILISPIPQSISLLTALSFLDLHNNSLTSTLAPSIGKLPKLSIINLSYNKFHGVIPTTFGTLSVLKELDVRCNSLTGIIPTSLISLKKFNYVGGNNNLMLPSNNDDIGIIGILCFIGGIICFESILRYLWNDDKNSTDKKYHTTLEIAIMSSDKNTGKSIMCEDI